MATKTIAPELQPDTTSPAELGNWPESTDEQIARRAYELYLAGHEGSELDHWLRAEEEIRRSI